MDKDSNEIAASLITLFIIWQVRRFLRTAPPLPVRWNWWFRRYWIINLVVIGAAQATDTYFPLRLLWLVALGMVAYTVWLVRSYQPARLLLLAVGPFMLFAGFIKILRGLAPVLMKPQRDNVNSLLLFAAIWMLTFYIIARRQKKVLLKAETEREAEAAERRVIEARKAELEALVAERTAEIMAQKETLQQTLDELKATQNQLIQSEKMASLGELTAGIAHEIQNPLNFVNNFAEVSTELIDELTEGLTNGDRAEVTAIAGDLRQNLQKIAHHGGRASSIVRGMLEHSRKTTGLREPTDLNALADEYLRLAYHGLRAKDKNFNAELITNFETNLPRPEVMPQDMGRVLLNLYTNAFYAVRQKQQAAPADYQPTIRVSTRRMETGVEIRVGDNGTGIPDAVKAKIFQPFFTTKPTGEGTGLGLSLAYDIVTKGHGGTLTVESEEGVGTTFLIDLPA